MDELRSEELSETAVAWALVSRLQHRLSRAVQWPEGPADGRIARRGVEGDGSADLSASIVFLSSPTGRKG